MIDEERIYVVVAETVDTPNGRIIQPCGRAIAQACHAITKMQITSRIWMQREAERKIDIEDMPFAECTTIILAARDGNELEHVNFLLANAGIQRHVFADTNAAVYGENFRVATALATIPIEPMKIFGILDYLPLWSHSHAD